MYFDALTMAAIASEFSQTILGGRVQRILQTSPLSIALEIYSQHQRFHLLVSAHPERAGVHLVESKPTRDPQASSPLLLHLRKRIRGAFLRTVETPPLERILFLHFCQGSLPPTEQENTLIIEVMGRHSNVILLDHEGLVLDCIKRVTPQMSSVRPMLPRKRYQSLPQQLKMDPRLISPENLSRALANLAPDLLFWQALVNLYRGVSPLLAREVVFRACGQTDITLSDSCPLDRLAQELTEMWKLPQSKRWAPCLALKNDLPAAYAPYLLTHQPGWEVRPLVQISMAIEACSLAQESFASHDQLRQALLKAVDRYKERLQKRLAALQDELTRADQAEALRRKGEWLLAYQYQVSPGQTLLEVEEFDIELDPQLNPVENAQAYFTAYRKAIQAGRDQPQRIEETSQALAWLEEMIALLFAAESYDEIAVLTTELEEAGIHLPRSGAPRRKAKLPPRTFRSQDGFTILVGRNARQNEYLALQRAHPHDLWLHARGRPGAHVVILSEGRPIPQSTLEEAASLAAYYSQGSDEAQVVVDYTECRHVRRTGSRHPGLVRYDHERTLIATPTRLSESMPPAGNS